MVDAAWWALIDNCFPHCLLWAYVFSFPIECGSVAWGVRSLLDNFFLLWSGVLKLCIKAKMLNFAGFFVIFLDFVEGVKSHIQRIMSPWSWLEWISLQGSLSLFAVLWWPEFMISLIQCQLWRYWMRVMHSRSRCNITEPFCVHVEVNFFTGTLLLFFQFIKVGLFLLEWFFNTISTNSWRFSVLLLHLDTIQEGIFAQFRINFVFLSCFLELREVPFILRSMHLSRGNSFANFKLIVHIETFLSEIFSFLDPFLLRLPFPLLNLKISIEFLPRSVVFRDIPRNIGMVVILVHGRWVNGGIWCFWVIHSHNKFILLSRHQSSIFKSIKSTNYLIIKSRYRMFLALRLLFRNKSMEFF